MDSENDVPKLAADDFARRFSMRADRLMWLLGAGASASAGMPTAWDMTWEFKQRLYVSQRRVSPHSVADLSSPAIRAELQAHIDSPRNLPIPGTPDEYAALFEAVYPAEADRRVYLDSKMAGAKPSYGHFALATLMRAELTKLVWTTNFDPLVADACAKVYDGTGPLTTVALDAPDLAVQCVEENRFPVEIKLHGDFRSRRLKNTNDELRQQDQRLRQVLVDSCKRFGLIVAGYSGRDSSIMEALEDVLNQDVAFPSGLFWLHRGDDQPLDRVHRLLVRARDAGVEAALVRIENFDEAMQDLIRLQKGLDTTVLDSFAAERRPCSAAPSPQGHRGWPIVRFNALPIVETPTICRRIVCSVGGYADIRKLVEQAGVVVLFARTRAGVLAFGADSDLRSVFKEKGITEYDLYTIETKRLRYDSGERGLLRDALARAISHHRGVDVIRRRSKDLMAPVDPLDNRWKPLKSLVGSLGGTVSGHPELNWREGIQTRLDWADERLWLLIDPCTVFDGINDQNKAAAADFARERTVRRYNRQLNNLIEFWAELLAGEGGQIRALRVGDGVDAAFILSSDTAFSRRVGA